MLPPVEQKRLKQIIDDLQSLEVDINTSRQEIEFPIDHIPDEYSLAQGAKSSKLYSVILEDMSIETFPAQRKLIVRIFGRDSETGLSRRLYNIQTALEALLNQQ